MQQQWGLGEAVVMLRAQCFAWLWLIALIPDGCITSSLGSHSPPGQPQHLHTCRPAPVVPPSRVSQADPARRQSPQHPAHVLWAGQIHEARECPPPNASTRCACPSVLHIQAVSEQSVSLCVAPLGMGSEPHAEQQLRSPHPPASKPEQPPGSSPHQPRGSYCHQVFPRTPTPIPIPSSHLWTHATQVSISSRFSLGPLWKCLGRRFQPI